MQTRFAIEAALRVINAHRDEVGPNQGGYEQLRATLEGILAQEGCEVFDEAAPTLCDLCDVIMHG